MLDAFFIAATGMESQQLNVDTIANNLANVNTPAYKKVRISFGDLMTAPHASSVGEAADGFARQRGAGFPELGGAPRYTGAGVAVLASEKLFETGVLSKTGSSVDLAIEGEGFLEVSAPDGGSAYVRGGTMKIDQDGLLTTLAGLALKPGLTVPPETLSLRIAADGRVSAVLADRSAAQDLGQLSVVRFLNPQGLLATGNNVYRSSLASGEAIGVRPGQDGAGTLAQGYLENANVSMVDKMLALLIAQRAYGASARLVQASDEMMGLINSLRR